MDRLRYPSRTHGVDDKSDHGSWTFGACRPQPRAAIANGKHTATEVPAAITAGDMNVYDGIVHM